MSCARQNIAAGENEKRTTTALFSRERAGPERLADALAKTMTIGFDAD